MAKVDLVDLEAIPWEMVEARVYELDPTLADLLRAVCKEVEQDQDEGTSEVFLARYPYGHEIVTDGHFSPPKPDDCPQGADGLWRRCLDRVCADCGGTGSPGLSIPLTIVLRNTVEVTFAPRAALDRMIPLRLLGQAEIYGVFEVLDHIHRGDPEPSPWTIVSGCRSAYLMMRRGNKKLREELREKLRGTDWADADEDNEKLHGTDWADADEDNEKLHGADWADADEDNWKLLRAIARESYPAWCAEILLLPRAWFVGGTPARMRLRSLIGQIAWRQSAHMRKSQIHEAQIERAINHCDLPIDSLQALHHLSHIISIGRGGAVAFRPAKDEDERSGPFAACEKFLRGLKKLASRPVILVPTHLNQHEPVGYYSLSVPSLFGFVPKDPKPGWVNGYLRPLSSLIKKRMFLEAIPHSPIAWDKVRIYGIVKDADQKVNLRHRRELCNEFEIDHESEDGAPPLTKTKISPADRFLVACIKVMRDGGTMPDEIIRPG
jgi:hypothetical protein